MPTDLEAGSIWRQRNAARSAGRPSIPRPPVTEKPEPAPKSPPPAPTLDPELEEDPKATKEAETLAERPEEIIVGERSCLDALKAVRSSRQYCQSRIAACHQRGDEAMAQKWVQTLNAIVTRQQLLEERFRDIMERDGKTMSLEAATSRLMQALRDEPGFTSIISGFRANTPQYFLDIDRQAAKNMGISLADLNETLQVCLGSAYVNDFNLFGRTYQVTAMAEPRFRVRPDDVIITLGAGDGDVVGQWVLEGLRERVKRD
jgi:hypothetical protein